MQFVIYCLDKPNSAELRTATRAAHLNYLDGRPIDIVIAGPLLDASGAMKGSMLVVEANDLAEVQRFAAADPYRKAGLFQRVDIDGFRKVYPK